MYIESTTYRKDFSILFDLTNPSIAFSGELTFGPLISSDSLNISLLFNIVLSKVSIVILSFNSIDFYL